MNGQGLLDGWKPLIYMPLRAQTPMGKQADLFGSIAPSAPAAVCAHSFDPCEQITMTGGTARICTLCQGSVEVGSGTAQSRITGSVIFRFDDEGGEDA